MKKLLSYIHWKHLKHLYATEEKKLPHYHRVLQSFFRSRNGKLIVILIIAAMIPLTVLGVQTVQNLQQEAAAEKVRMCTAAEVNPIIAESPGKVTFTGNGVNTTTHGFGNNVDDKTCVAGSGSVTCNTKGNFTKKDKTTGKTINTTENTSTWFTLESGSEVAICQYTITKKSASGPKPSKNPTPPKGTTATPKPAGGNCTVTVAPANCTADNKPRLQASWDLQNATRPCKVVLKKDGKAWELASDCNRKDAFNIQTLPDGTSLTSEQTYQIDVYKENKVCKTASVKAPKCAGAATPTTNPKGGTATPTPKSGTTTLGKPQIKNSVCSDDAKKVSISWDSVTGAEKYSVTLSGDKNQTSTASPDRKSDFTITPKQKYSYTIKAIKGTQTTTSESASFTCTAKSPTPAQVPGSAGARNICEKGVCLTPTPTKVPISTKCPGGVCP